jgi:hypothetical protein
LQFTRQNLKLVHIVCHDKQVHADKKCDSDQFYISGQAASDHRKRKTAATRTIKKNAKRLPATDLGSRKRKMCEMKS